MTRVLRLTSAAILLGGLAAAGAAVAQDAPPPAADEDPMVMPMPMLMPPRGPAIDFAVIDADGDGIVTRGELTARATERLGTQDANGDGALDRAEIIAAMPGPRDSLLMVFAPDPAEQRADRLLAFMGAAESGRVEIVALSERQVNGLLAWIDRDRDGAISQEEADSAERRGPWHTRGHGGTFGGMRGDEHGPRHPRG